MVSVAPSASTSIALLAVSVASAGIAARVVHSAADEGAVVGARVGAAVAGLVAGGAVLAGAAALVAGAAERSWRARRVVDVVVVDVDVDDVLEVESGADTGGLDSWSSRAQPLINTTTTAAAAGNLRTAAVFHGRDWSVGQLRRLEARRCGRAASPGQRARAEAFAQRVERVVERRPVLATERQQQLLGHRRRASIDIRLPTDSPSSVRPRSSIVSSSDRRIDMATAAIGSVPAVGCASERARVARPKSSYRNRSVTVRPTRPALRIRRVTRSTMPSSNVSIAPPTSGRDGAPTATRSNRDAGPSRPAVDRGCGRARQLPPDATPRIDDQLRLAEPRDLAAPCRCRGR